MSSFLDTYYNFAFSNIMKMKRRKSGQNWESVPSKQNFVATPSATALRDRYRRHRRHRPRPRDCRYRRHRRRRRAVRGAAAEPRQSSAAGGRGRWRVAVWVLLRAFGVALLSTLWYTKATERGPNRDLRLNGAVCHAVSGLIDRLLRSSPELGHMLDCWGVRCWWQMFGICRGLNGILFHFILQLNFNSNIISRKI